MHLFGRFGLLGHIEIIEHLVIVDIDPLNYITAISDHAGIGGTAQQQVTEALRVQLIGQTISALQVQQACFIFALQLVQNAKLHFPQQPVAISLQHPIQLLRRGRVLAIAHQVFRIFHFAGMAGTTACQQQTK